MKRAYPIDDRKAIDRLHSYLNRNSGSIQLILPLADLAQRLRHGVSQMLFEAERDLLVLIMNNEIQWLTQPGMANWGTAPGSVIIHGQKVPVDRPPLRGQRKEAKLGSDELFRREEEMQRRVWDKVVRSVSMRRYDPVVRGSKPSFGIGKSAISERFIVASGQRAQDLRQRDLSPLRLWALMLDGVEFRKELFLVALGINKPGRKRSWAITRARPRTSRSAISCWRDWRLVGSIRVKACWWGWTVVEPCALRSASSAETKLWWSAASNTSNAISASISRWSSGRLGRRSCPTLGISSDTRKPNAHSSRFIAPAPRAVWRRAWRKPSRCRNSTSPCHCAKRFAPPTRLNPFSTPFVSCAAMSNAGGRAINGNVGFAPACGSLKKKFRRIDGYRELPSLIDILAAQFGSSKAISRTA